MARARRLTVRLADLEFQSIRKFAGENHVLPAVAVRRLLSVGLAFENRIGAQDVHQTKTRPHHLADGQPSAL
jgi:hypothetical protein